MPTDARPINSSQKPQQFIRQWQILTKVSKVIFDTFQATVQRYILVAKPHLSKDLTSTKSVKKWIVAVVICTVLYSIPFYFKYNIVYFERVGRYLPKRAKWSDNYAYNILYDLISYFTVLAIIPLCILTFTTYKLIRTLRESKKKKMTTTTSLQNSKEDITLSLVIVVIIYAVCQIPNPTRHIWTLFDDENFCGSSYYAFMIFAFTVIHINSSVNFIVFILIGKRFRKKFFSKFQRIFCCKKIQVAPAIETISVAVTSTNR